MCGIVGFFSRSNLSSEQASAYLELMSQAIAHRGPDGEGFWSDPEYGIALSHRRLAILDLTPQGHQPMRSASGRYVMTFNGEIYNHRELREELNAYRPIQWQGHSDTEVMLSAFDQWGIEQALPKLTGMFAFAVWDRVEEQLYLGRDRLGEKPLYYGWGGNTFLFASELKALKKHPSFRKELSLQAIGLYLKYGYIPEPFSIYKEIFKLKPGTFVRVTKKDLQHKHPPVPQSFWSLKDVAQEGQKSPFPLSEEDAIHQGTHLLNRVIQRQMDADVPVGAFLSGGIDSSLVVALMQNQRQTPIKTFTIGFQAADLDEAVYAKKIASLLKTDHTELYVSDQQARDVIPLLPSLYDEPFADSSQIPTYLVAQLAQQHVKVCLSGDGGDEVFGGYNRHVFAHRLAPLMHGFPSFFRKPFGNFLQNIPPSLFNTVSSLAPHIPLLRGKIPSSLGDKIGKIGRVLSYDKEAIYQTLVSHFQDISPVVLFEHRVSLAQEERNSHEKLGDLASQMMLQDSLTYLPGDILVKVDRAAMAVGLETRIPFLDKEIVEFAWRLPLSLKIRQGQGKWVLRQILKRYVSSSLIERPKQGFAVPLETWLRGPLRSWVDSLLSEKNLKEKGILDPVFVQHIWHQHRSGRQNWHHQLWCLLMVQAWMNETM